MSARFVTRVTVYGRPDARLPRPPRVTVPRQSPPPSVEEVALRPPPLVEEVALRPSRDHLPDQRGLETVASATSSTTEGSRSRHSRHHRWSRRSLCDRL